MKVAEKANNSKGFVVLPGERIVVESRLNENASGKKPRVFKAETAIQAAMMKPESTVRILKGIEKDSKTNRRFVRSVALLPWFTKAEIEAGAEGMAKGIVRLDKVWRELYATREGSDSAATVTVKSAVSAKNPNEFRFITFDAEYVKKPFAQAIFDFADKGCNLTVQGPMNQSLTKLCVETVSTSGSVKSEEEDSLE